MQLVIRTQTLLWSVVAMALLAGCAASAINTDAVERANRSLERTEARGPTTWNENEKRLWQDQPVYAALLAAPTPVKRVRLVSAAVPHYPTFLRLAHINAKVSVSMVIGTDGHVEAARVIESSDTRFNDSAVEAARRYTWLAASDGHEPARDMVVIPFDYFWGQKAIDAARNK